MKLPVDLVQKHEEEKWNAIRAEIFESKLFRNYNKCSSDTLKRKFQRMEDKVSEKYALEKEGANLSAIEATSLEQIDVVEKIIYDMIFERLTRAAAQEEKNEKLKHEKKLW
jgi:hypothetical protein